jgi:hypothetical protein
MYMRLRVKYLSHFNEHNFHEGVFKKKKKKRTEISNFVKTRPVRSEPFHEDRRSDKDRHEKANSRF